MSHNATLKLGEIYIEKYEFHLTKGQLTQMKLIMIVY